MIGYEEAQALVCKHVPPPKKEKVALFAALGCVVAQDVRSPLAMPLFDNSAMDGFVFRSADTRQASPEQPVHLKICGALSAGTATVRLRPHESWRIMTGAPIPYGADTVMVKEKAKVVNDALLLYKPFLSGHNVRRKGEELKVGERVVGRGTPMHPALVGIMAALGKKEIEIYKKPRVSLIATGSELVAPGSDLSSGKIYDSNSFMVHAALMQIGIRPVFSKRLGDQPKKIRQVVGHALRESDLLILMGGVSTGDTDYVKPVLRELGVRSIFWKVSQKPGKPIYFGKKGSTLVFGLPGNPAAVFTCFYEYVYPAIRRWMGFREPFLDSMSVPVKESIQADLEKSLFLKAKMERFKGKPTVRPLHRQSSHMISSLYGTNAILVVSPGGSVEEGQNALVHLLPYEVGTSHES